MTASFDSIEQAQASSPQETWRCCWRRRNTAPQPLIKENKSKGCSLSACCVSLFSCLPSFAEFRRKRALSKKNAKARQLGISTTEAAKQQIEDSSAIYGEF